MFKSSAVEDWNPEYENDGDVTAMCPHCGIDAVYPIEAPAEGSPAIVAAMHKYWFERTVELPLHDGFLQRLRIRAEPLLRRISWDVFHSWRAAG